MFFFKFRSIFGNKIFFDPILQQEGGKDMHFRYTKHIKRTSRVWKSIWGADLFSTCYSRKMTSGSLFFTKSAILPIFDPILQQEGGKDLHFRYTTHITRTSRVWKSIWGAYLLVHVIFEKWPQDHYFSQKVLFYPFLTQYYNRKGKKDLHIRFITHIKRTSLVWQSIWGSDIFSTSYGRKKASGSLFFTKSALGGDPYCDGCLFEEYAAAVVE